MSEFSHLSRQSLLRVRKDWVARRLNAQSKGQWPAVDNAQKVLDEIDALLPNAHDNPEDDGGQGALL